MPSRRLIAEPMTSEQIEEAFRTAAGYAVSSRMGKLRRAPIRTATIKVASLTCRGLRTTISVRGKTFWGGQIRVLMPEPVSEQVLSCGLFEPSVTAYMLRVLRPGDVFFDVGAHFGYFSLLGAWITGEDGQVHSFEPMPATFRILGENTVTLKTVSLNQLAVWSRNTNLNIKDFGPRLSAFNSVYHPRMRNRSSRIAAARMVKVQAVTLDHYCHETKVAPNFIKIDAESAEHEIIQGMHRILTNGRPVISIEVGDFDLEGVPTSAELLTFIMGHGYLPFHFSDEDIRPHRLRGHYSYDNILLLPEEQVGAI
jgi:FkbM family methyltransferase